MKKKTVMLVAAIAMILCLAVGGTLAYFTDTTETYKNTFTMGNVKIELAEATEADPDNNIVAGDKTDEGITYTNMKPGFTYSKIPTVTVKDGSEDCYMVLEMDMTKYVSLINLMMLNDEDAEATTTTAYVNELVADKAHFQKVVDTWFTGINHKDWQIMNLEDLAKNLTNPDAHLVLYLGYIGEDSPLSAGEDVTFMTGFTVPASVTQDQLERGYMSPTVEGKSASDISGMTISFKAYAIQAEGIADINAAYTAMIGEKLF